MATKKQDQPTGWVIRNPNGEYLWVTPEGAFAWTSQSKWALRLAREQDAQMLSAADKNAGEIGRQETIEEEPNPDMDEAGSLEAATRYGRGKKT